MSNQTLKDCMARVFSAVDINDEQILEELQRVQNKLDLGFKLVPAEKMHITFEFFKDLKEQEIETLKQALNDISMESFELEIKDVGTFPSEDYIRVVWAGAENDKIRELYDQVADHGLESSNDHDFVPHITLIRVENVSGGDKRKLKKAISEHRLHRFGKTTVNSIELFESRLTGKGSEYRKLYSKQL